MLVFFLVVLILFVGLVVDLGFAYQTKAALAKAADAAALTGIRNVFLGQERARDLALSAFSANYPANGRDVAPPAPEVEFGLNANNEWAINVTASVHIDTYFIRVLPQWKTLTVGASAQAIRAKVVLDLALDRSYSMTLNGGSNVLAGAVESFLSVFEDSYDEVGMVSFASDARVDVSTGHPFKTIVSGAIAGFNYAGSTFADGGLGLARRMVLNKVASMPANEAKDAVKVVLFFTDGYANGHTNSFPCPTARTLLLSSNYPQMSPLALFLHDTNGVLVASCIVSNSNSTCGDTSSACSIPTQFQSIGNNIPKAATPRNVQLEGELRAEDTANRMRNANILIFSVGLGDQVNLAFLKRIANDPTSPSVNVDQPQGEAVVAATAQDLEPVLQTIAQKILTRLTR